jgi:hypothetical protein
MNCPFCKKEALWCENKAIYGRNYGASYMCYWCKNCDAYVSCHNNSKTPMGTMANNETRKWRMKAHEHIDSVWKNGEKSRKKVYKQLAHQFGKEIHIGSADIEMCKKILETII